MEQHLRRLASLVDNTEAWENINIQVWKTPKGCSMGRLRRGLSAARRRPVHQDAARCSCPISHVWKLVDQLS